jgi:hypothetical protein
MNIEAVGYFNSIDICKFKVDYRPHYKALTSKLVHFQANLSKYFGARSIWDHTMLVGALAVSIEICVYNKY